MGKFVKLFGVLVVLGLVGFSIFQSGATRELQASLGSQQSLLNGSLTTTNLDPNLIKQIELASLVAGALPVKNEKGDFNSCDQGQVLSFMNGKVICVNLSSANGGQIVVTEAGPPGRDGADGAAGNDGAVGSGGAAGNDGATGTSGVDGTNGIDGANGNTGPQGLQGSQGVPGVLTTTNGNGISSSITGQVLSLNILTSVGGGLSNGSNGLSLLATCSNNELLKWNGSSWSCAADEIGSVSAGNLTSATPGVTIAGGTGSILGSGTSVSIATASSSQSGLMSAVDWNTFNNKQAALTFNGRGIFTNIGDTVEANTCSADQVFKFNGTTWVCANDVNTTYTAGAGLQMTAGNVLSFNPGGFSTISGIAGSDQLLVFDGTNNVKISYDDLFGGILGALNYRGTWAASTNTPDLSSLCTLSTKGYYYVVSVSGSSSIGGDFDMGNQRLGSM